MGYERYPRGRSQDDWNRDIRSQDDDAAARDYGSGRDDYGERGYYSRNRMQDTGGRYGGEDYRGSTGGYGRGTYGAGQRDYGRPQQGYNYDDRGFFDRAGDEVRSWFGDNEAERRRELDQQNARDREYHTWRSNHIASLDRDYDEYRRENQQRFSNEFGSWRTERQGQRSSLSAVVEHMDVIGSDGAHIGTVDKVRGDRIILTKSDPDAGGRHHSIPSRWIQNVDDKVTVRKTADEAKTVWRDEERGAFFGEDESHRDEDAQGRILNRSFSGTY